MPDRVPPRALIVAGGLVALGCLVARVWVFTADDSYITFRYSQHLAAGLGPVWNPGEPPVEGYTTFLWMVVMAVPHLLGVEPALCAKLLGVLCTLGTLWLAYGLARHLQATWQTTASDLWPAVGVLLLGVFPATAAHAVSGMETALYTLLLTALLYAATLSAGDLTPRRAFGLAALGLLTGLTRPEGNFALLLVAAVLWVLVPRDRRSLLLRALLLVYAVPGLGYYAWRYAYYGHLFPLPFYVKTTGEFLAGWPLVVHYLGTIALPLAVLAGPGLRARADRRLLPAAAAAAGLAVFFVLPKHLMGYEARYLFPVTPTLIAVAVVGMGETVRLLTPWLTSRPRRQRALLLAIVAALVLAKGVDHYRRGVLRSVASRRGYGTCLNAAHVALGKYLAGYPGPRPLVAFNDAGAIPYFSGWHGLDLWGLNDPTIALGGKAEPGYSDYVLGRRPDLVIIGSSSGTDYQPTWPWEPGLHRRLLEAGMKCVKVVTYDEDVYYLWLFARPDSEVGRYAARWVQPVKARAPRGAHPAGGPAG
jgi:arabinofuranosyltransferase